jgi:hypothetical protein
VYLTNSIDQHNQGQQAAGFSLKSLMTPLAVLFEKLEKKASDSCCDWLIKYHSDLFQVENSLLFDGRADMCSFMCQ